MNEMLASECTSGCESGWTLYFEQSHNSSYHHLRANNEENRAPAYDEEDESMVSDASSGPPVDRYYDGSSFFSPIDHAALQKENRGKRKKNRAKQSKKGQEHHHASLLDDTASSPIFNYPQQNNFTAMNHQASMESSILDYSQGFSATHFEGRPQVYEPLSIYQPSLSTTQMQQQNQWFGGKWG